MTISPIAFTAPKTTAPKLRGAAKPTAEAGLIQRPAQTSQEPNLIRWISSVGSGALVKAASRSATSTRLPKWIHHGISENPLNDSQAAGKDYRNETSPTSWVERIGYVQLDQVSHPSLATKGKLWYRIEQPKDYDNISLPLDINRFHKLLPGVVVELHEEFSGLIKRDLDPSLPIIKLDSEVQALANENAMIRMIRTKQDQEAIAKVLLHANLGDRAEANLDPKISLPSFGSALQQVSHFIERRLTEAHILSGSVQHSDHKNYHRSLSLKLDLTKKEDRELFKHINLFMLSSSLKINNLDPRVTSITYYDLVDHQSAHEFQTFDHSIVTQAGSKEHEDYFAPSGSLKHLFAYRSELSSAFAGDKKILWEAYSNDEKSMLNSCLLKIKLDDNSTINRQEKIADYYKLAQIFDPEKLSSSNGQTKSLAHIEIDITPEGANQLSQTKKDQATAAYLKSATVFKPELKDLLNKLPGDLLTKAIKLAVRYQQTHHLIPVWPLGSHSQQIEKEYKDLTGRELSNDYSVLIECNNFGEEVEQMAKTRRPQQVASSFADLGERQGFNFLNTIAAFHELVGPEQIMPIQFDLNPEN